jgi:DNA invertase Pin-like site-specific DNA recombinase
MRLSDEDKNKLNPNDDSESIQNQKMILTKYAVDQGWEIYDFYSDDDYSGLDRDRPDFNRMIHDAEQGKFHIVLCKHQSRFTRDAELIEKYLHRKFIEWNIRFVSVVDNVDTKQKGTKKSRQINALVNEWMCEDISEAIKAVFDSKREDGKFIGSFACYGYEKDHNDKNKLIIDEEAAEVVRLIYKYYMEGYGTQHIAFMLNEQGIPNPTTYKQNKGLNFINASQSNGHKMWNKTTVKRMLKNEMYIGNMVQGIRKKVNYKSKKIVNVNNPELWYVVDGTHPPIIDTETFYSVQKRIRSNVRSSGTGQAHVLATKVKCIDCGSTMSKVTGSNGYSYLRCGLYARGSKICTSHSINFKKLQELVLTKLKERIQEYCAEDNIISEVNQRNLTKDKYSVKVNDLYKITKLIEEKTQHSKNLYIDKLKGVITEEQFIEFNKLFIDEKEQLIKRQEFLKQEVELLKSKSKDEEETNKKVKQYMNLKTLSHPVVTDTIDYIEVGEKDKETGNQVVKINWLF